MKKTVLFALCFVTGGLMQLFSQPEDIFYYHNKEKITLEKNSNVKFIHFKETKDETSRINILNRLKASNFEVFEINPLIYKVSGKTLLFEGGGFFSEKGEKEEVLYISDMFLYRDSTIQWLSNEITVNIPPSFNLSEVLKNFNIPFQRIKQIGYDPNTFIIELDVENKTALEYANLLDGSGIVAWAQPSFWKMIKKQNTYFSSQWGLNNTGQYDGISGMDINATGAWSTASGTGIKVAVIDEGVDLTHPDLMDNLPVGYDATDAAYGGSNGGYGGDYYVEDAHGTCCSGIIAAINNNIGTKGVSYNSKIIPVRIAYSNSIGYWTTNDSWIADGIYKAWHDYNADILSNSWGGGSPSTAINAQISAALSQGRNNLGSIVVFSSGNNNSSILYPANSNPDIVVVGAMSECGERKNPASCDGENWGSSYGTTLDIVAPGVLIATTDIQGDKGYNPKLPVHPLNGGTKISTDFTNQDYTVWFNGTSSACPHVAGVTALILSVNPTLTGQQVRDIIESTAQKVGNYTYSTASEHPNGTWNNQMGYGLIDAYNAVQKAQCTVNFTNQTVTSDTTVVSCGDIYVRNVTVTNGAKLTLDAAGEVNIISDFEVKLGSELEIKQ